MRRTSWWFAAWAFGLVASATVLTAGAAADTATVDVLDHPEVVVTSTSCPTREDFDAATDRCRTFSPRVLVRNTDAEGRTYGLWLDAHLVPPTGDCAIDRTTPVHLFAKTKSLERGVGATVGGSTEPAAAADAYWPAAVYDTYAGRDGQVHPADGMHTFCVHVVDMSPGATETCPAPCVRATGPFQAYLRTTNEAPYGSFEWGPRTIAPGTEVAFRATVADNDTVPRPDALVASWDFGNGRAAEGGVVRTTYEVAGAYTVTLSVTDGFDPVTRTAVLVVAAPDDGGGADDGRADQPWPWTAAVVSTLAVAWLRRRTR